MQHMLPHMVGRVVPGGASRKHGALPKTDVKSHVSQPGNLGSLRHWGRGGGTWGLYNPRLDHAALGQQHVRQLRRLKDRRQLEPLQVAIHQADHLPGQAAAVRGWANCQHSCKQLHS